MILKDVCVIGILYGVCVIEILTYNLDYLVLWNNSWLLLFLFLEGLRSLYSW